MITRRQTGFTIIELVVVIVIIGILAAVALPRFLGLQDRAHDAVVEGTQGALASGVLMANSIWMTHAKETALDNIMERDVDVLADNAGVANKCEKVWPYGADPETPKYERLEVSLDANKRGYPVGHSIFGDGTTDRCSTTPDASISNGITPDDDGDVACHEVFEFLLSQQSVKSFPAALTGTGTPFAADHLEFEADAPAANTCTFTYTPDKSPGDVQRVITYDALTGKVTVTGLTTADYSDG